MISDKERSEVAKAFRSVAKVIKRREGSGMQDLCAAWMALSTAIKGRIAFCDTSDVFDALADLIDRPTCHISETDHEFEDSVRCDRCRTTFNRPWEPFKYCPNCGAEVADDARL